MAELALNNSSPAMAPGMLRTLIMRSAGAPLVLLVLLIALPQIALWLPTWLYG